MNANILLILKLAVSITVILMGVSFIFGAKGKFKTIDNDILKIAKANEKYYGGNAELHVRKRYKMTGIVMTVAGIFSLLVFILNEGKPLILK